MIRFMNPFSGGLIAQRDQAGLGTIDIPYRAAVGFGLGMFPIDRRRLVSRGLILLAALGAASGTAAAPGGDGGVVGWVEDAKGAPVAGALVSLFGRGLRDGGLITLSDSTGRFFLPALPAGSYTIRALGHGKALSQRITVLPNQDSIFTLSFAPAGQRIDLEAALENASPNDRELKWLLRHKRRSVLEARSVDEQLRTAESIQQTHNLLETLLPWIPELGGAVEVMASPAPFGTTTEARGLELGAPSLGSLKLNGRLSESSRWSLGGLVADSESATWRMAAEFIVEPGAGHRLQAGAGYGTRVLQPGFSATGEGRLDNRTVGAVFVHDRWQLGQRLALDGGARYSYIGFVGDKSGFSPTLGVEFRAARNTRLRAFASARTLVPGGDLLTLSTLQAAPAMAIALVGADVRPERVTRQELAIDQAAGKAALSAFLFHEGVRDRLINETPRHGAHRELRILNGRGLLVRGGGLSLSGGFGDVVKSTLTYSYGRSRPGSVDPSLSSRHVDWALASSNGSFHDVVARLETFVDWSGTRLVAYYRWNSCQAEAAGRAGAPLVSQRFDVQLSQGLPFLRSMTRTEWELLLAFRNMFYEASEAALLDEIAVVNPPRRVLGGISVRF